MRFEVIVRGSERGVPAVLEGVQEGERESDPGAVPGEDDADTEQLGDDAEQAEGVQELPGIGGS